MSLSTQNMYPSNPVPPGPNVGAAESESEVREVIRCKFKCTSVTTTPRWNSPGFLYTAEFGVVTGHEKHDPVLLVENAKFFEATPSGSLKIGTIKQDVFTPGEEYYLDIVKS